MSEQTTVIVSDGGGDGDAPPDNPPEQVAEQAAANAVVSAAAAVAVAAEAVEEAKDTIENGDDELWRDLSIRFDVLEAQHAATQEMLRIMAEAMASIQGQMEATAAALTETLSTLKAPSPEATQPEAMPPEATEPTTGNSPSESGAALPAAETARKARRIRVV